MFKSRIYRYFVIFLSEIMLSYLPSNINGAVFYGKTAAILYAAEKKSRGCKKSKTFYTLITTNFSKCLNSRIEK